MTLRLSLEVSLLKRLEVALERLWGSGEASLGGSGGGDPGVGAALVPPGVGRRSRTAPPWKVLRPAVPRARRARSAAPAAMLWLEGDGGGARLLSLPLCSSGCRSLPPLSVHT